MSRGKNKEKPVDGLVTVGLDSGAVPGEPGRRVGTPNDEGGGTPRLQDNPAGGAMNRRKGREGLTEVKKRRIL